MNAIRVTILGALAATLLFPASTVAEIGNDNPTGTSGSFNGEVTTGGAYDPYTGNAKRSITDLAIPGSVGTYPLAFTRTLNTRYTPGIAVEFGEAGGWRHSFQWSIDSHVISSRSSTYEDMPTSYTVNYPDGRRVVFRDDPRSSDSRMFYSPGVAERFRAPAYAYSGSQPCALLLPDGGTIHFDAYVQRDQADDQQPWTSTFDFHFSGISDPHGLVTSISYPADGSMTVAEPAGRWIKVFYRRLENNDGTGETVVDRIEGSDGRRVKYNYFLFVTPLGIPYNALGQVIYFPDASGSSPITATYSYQEDNVDADGRPLVLSCDDPMFAGPMKKIAYNFLPAESGGVYGQIEREQHPNGTTVSALSVDDASARTETRGDGPTRRFHYSGARLAFWSDFKGAYASQGVDGNGFVNRITDRNQHTTDLTNNPLTGATAQVMHPSTASDNGRATAKVMYGGASCHDPNNKDGNNPYYVCTTTDEREQTTRYWRYSVDSARSE